MGCAASLTDLRGKMPAEVLTFPGDLLKRTGEMNLDPGDLFFAWEIARLAGQDMALKKQRVLTMLVLAVQVMSVEGSTRLPLTEGGHLDRILKDLQADDQEKALIKELLSEVEEATVKPDSGGLANIFGNREQYRPLIIDHGCLYIQKLHALEGRVGSNLIERISAIDEAAAEIEAALQEVFSTPPAAGIVKTVLDEQQKLAVRKALGGRLTVVSGRPGSGKTSIVASILRVLARTGNPPLQSIALAAPSGKAAERMRQSVTDHLTSVEDAGEPDRRLIDNCPPATTLHRLLGYSPGKDRFWHNEFNPLSEKLVIVDESSMIDLTMIDHLLRALQPEANLILLGDADQLPSIEAGAVLRDLCRSSLAVEKKKRVVALEKSYRAREEDSAGKSILELAAAINKGQPPEEAKGGSILDAKREVQEIIFAGVENLAVEDEPGRTAFLSRWHELLVGGLPDLDERLQYKYRSGPAGFDPENTAKLKETFAYFERFRILCATRRSTGGTGSEEVNAWFYYRWLEYLRHKGIVTARPHFLVGEPVMMTRNDYALRLYNGDSGLVLYVEIESESRQRPAEPMAVFPRSGSFVAYPLEALRGRLEPAWATTVHKAQGSEYENVAIILPTVYVRTLTRELLYTAVTRAKKSVVILGSEEILKLGVSHSLKRASGLADMLR